MYEDNDGANETATLAHAASGGDYGSVTGNVGVTVTDDDTPALVFAPASVTVVEGHAASYTVQLTSRPTAPVTVRITGHAGTGLTPRPAGLTFGADSSSWNTPQRVTVTARMGAGPATLAHTASGGDYGSVTGNVGVTVTADETAALVVNPTALLLREGGARIARYRSRSYTVALATRPSAQVAVAISGHLGTDLTLNKTSLTFTTSNWNTAQTVTVDAGHDADVEDDTATLTLTASGGGYGSVTASVQVVTEEDDTVHPLVRRGAMPVSNVSVTEGSDFVFEVAPSQPPSTKASMALSVRGRDSEDVTLDKALLIFAPMTNESQTVTLSVAEDDDAVDDMAEIRIYVTHESFHTSGTLNIRVSDNDTPGLVFMPPTLGVAEGDDAEYTVRLATEPTATVTVAITGHSGTDLTLDPSSARLTFTTSTWNTAQTVTVSAGEDADANDDTATLSHRASGGDYASVSAERLGDDDRQRDGGLGAVGPDAGRRRGGRRRVHGSSGDAADGAGDGGDHGALGDGLGAGPHPRGL